MTTEPKTRENGPRDASASPRVALVPATEAARTEVRKTYKLFIAGKFPRSESGRSDPLELVDGGVANVCRASRKDFREAVVAARAAFPGWASRSAYNRGQILYRIAEVLEGRAAQFAAELALQGVDEAERQVGAAIDRLLHYAGWADKVQQVFSSVNPVASSHFNFSIVEPTGVVACVAPEEDGLLGLVSVLAPLLVGGNTAVVLASSATPLTAVTFTEVLHTSDVPAGVVNLLTGRRDELLEHFASHMDVNAIVYCGDDADERRLVEERAVENLKRTVLQPARDWRDDALQSPYSILATMEVKTTWHPIG